MYLELEFLKDLNGALNGSGQVKWNGSAGAGSQEDPDAVGAVEELRRLLTFCKKQLHSTAYDIAGEDFPKIEVCGGRTSLDFLDLLWASLTKVDCYSQLSCLWRQVVQT